MAKHQKEIQTESYIRVGEKLINTKDLNAEQKTVLATRLGIAYLNKLFKGKAEFWSNSLPAEDVFAEFKG